jgi:enoyl-CoA hydratase/carnithine racemase
MPADVQVEADDGVMIITVNRLTEDGRALPEAVALARQIAGNGPMAVAATKRVISESRDWPVGEAFERQRPISEAIRASEDAAEGARAFADKRKPVWRNR